MQKKSLFVILLLLSLMLLTITVPALAVSPKKIAVTAKTYNQVMDTTNQRTFTTDGGIVHTWGVVRTGMVDLTINGQPKITGTLWEIVDTSVNRKTGEVVIQNNPSAWTFAGGSFEGAKQTRITVENGVQVEGWQHVVFQGSGGFIGQKLELTQEWTLNPPTGSKTYIGTLLIP